MVAKLYIRRIAQSGFKVKSVAPKTGVFQQNRSSLDSQDSQKNGGFVANDRRP
jgi:hypothetical protein